MNAKTGPPSPLHVHAPLLRVIVIDDSITVRELLVATLQAQEGIRVVGTGHTGEDAIRLTKRMKPDVVLMDITMPEMDGLEATRHIMREAPLPIVLMTGTLMHTDLDLSFAALEAGALTVISKPGLADIETCNELIRTIKMMAKVPVIRRWEPSSSSPAHRPDSGPFTPPPGSAEGESPFISDLELRRCQVVGIAASTGGPGIIAQIFKALPTDFALPLLLVQHVTHGFAAGLADWLDRDTPLHVKLAAHGEPLSPGTVFVAPDDYHLQIDGQGYVELRREPPIRGLRPSANPLFRSLAECYRSHALGIILTGMGDDGVEGLQLIRRSGGLTIAQDEASCVIYGMPKEAMLRNAVDAILSPEEIAATLLRIHMLLKRLEWSIKFSGPLSNARSGLK